MNTFEQMQEGRPTGPLVQGYEVIIGFETHAQLSTASKIFSRASTAFGAEPNTQASAVDLALPGTLPVMNKGAVERAIRLGLALGSHIAPRSVFARKNYFYPDLPKGYQISQYEIPVVQGGSVSFFLGDEKKTVRLVRAHLEEDAGKSLHEDFVGQSGIDLNRAGTPLLEIVTEPDMRSTAEAVAYARELHKIVTWIGICDGNMQEGSFRCDANVSVRRPGAQAGHAARDQEPQQLQVHAAGDRLRDPLADRRAGRRPGDPAGHRAVRPRDRRDPRHAHQGRRGRLPLLPRPRPAAAGDRAGVDRARAQRDARAAARDGRALWARAWPVGLRRHAAHPEPGAGPLLRRGRARGRRAQAREQLDHRRDRAPAQPAGHRHRPGAGHGRPARRPDRAHRRRHRVEQRRAPGLRRAVDRRRPATSTRSSTPRA